LVPEKTVYASVIDFHRISSDVLLHYFATFEGGKLPPNFHLYRYSYFCKFNIKT